MGVGSFFEARSQYYLLMPYFFRPRLACQHNCLSPKRPKLVLLDIKKKKKKNSKVIHGKMLFIPIRPWINQSNDSRVQNLKLTVFG